MATVEFKVCDRCGKKISEHSRLRAKVSYRTYKIRWLIGGLTSEHIRELCGECSDKLDAFLYGKEESE